MGKAYIFKSKPKSIIAALVILCLVFVSIFLLPWFYARYSKQDSADPDEARAAKWSVSSVLPDTLDPITAGETVDGKPVGSAYALTVGSDSETALSYDFVLSGLPSGVTVQVYEGSEVSGEPILSAASDGSSEIVFENVGTMEAGEKSQDYILYFTAASTTVADSYEMGIDVIYTQLD